MRVPGGGGGGASDGASGSRPQAAIVVLTDRMLAAAAGHDVVAVCAWAVEAGADRVVVREKDLGRAHRHDLVAAIVAAVGGGRVIVATGSAPDAEEVLTWADLRVAGLHLASGRASGRGPSTASPGVAAALPWGRSCHDATDVAAAAASGASWVTASPVALSTSKVGYGPALGEAGLRRLVAAARTHGGPPPGVWALGGVDATNAASWPRAGADAVAVLGAVMSAPDPAAAVRDLRLAVDALPTPLDTPVHQLRGTS